MYKLNTSKIYTGSDYRIKNIFIPELTATQLVLLEIILKNYFKNMKFIKIVHYYPVLSVNENFFFNFHSQLIIC